MARAYLAHGYKSIFPDAIHHKDTACLSAGSGLLNVPLDTLPAAMSPPIGSFLPSTRPRKARAPDGAMN